MTILVSGASGFIGRNFMQATTNHTIIPVSLSKTPLENINFNTVDVVLHLAALVHQMKGAPEEKYYKINSDLTFDFAKKAKANGIKQFVFISTAKVFGESTTDGASFNEHSPCLPIDPYSKSKLQAEQRLKTLEDDTFTVSIIRIPLVYGTGVKGNLKSLMDLVNKTPIIPLGGINNKRSLLYVGNLIAIINKVIEKRQPGIFIACDNEPLSTTQLLELIARHFDKKIMLLKMPFLIKKMIAVIKPAINERLYGSFALNNTYTNKVLMYTQPFTVEEGIKDMVICYKKTN